VKWCTKCHVEKPITEFNPQKRGLYGVASYCRPCKNVLYREWLAGNKDKAKAAAKAWRNRNRDKVRGYKKAYRERHPERVARSMRNSRAKKPDMYRSRDRVHEERRRARKRSSHPAGVSVAEWESLVGEFNGCCAYCNQPTENPVMEHMDPISRGGIHHISNVVPSCARCNMAKRTLTVLEFLTGFRLDRKVEVAI